MWYELRNQVNNLATQILKVVKLKLGGRLTNQNHRTRHFKRHFSIRPLRFEHFEQRLALDASFSWQNPANQYDVDDDNAVTATDAILVINQLNQVGTSAFSVPYQPLSGTTASYTDVDGNGILNGDDAYAVINNIQPTFNATSPSPTASLLLYPSTTPAVTAYGLCTTVWDVSCPTLIGPPSPTSTPLPSTCPTTPTATNSSTINTSPPIVEIAPYELPSPSVSAAVTGDSTVSSIDSDAGATINGLTLDDIIVLIENMEAEIGTPIPETIWQAVLAEFYNESGENANSTESLTASEISSVSQGESFAPIVAVEAGWGEWFKSFFGKKPTAPPVSYTPAWKERGLSIEQMAQKLINDMNKKFVNTVLICQYLDVELKNLRKIQNKTTVQKQQIEAILLARQHFDCENCIYPKVPE